MILFLLTLASSPHPAKWFGGMPLPLNTGHGLSHAERQLDPDETIPDNPECFDDRPASRPRTRAMGFGGCTVAS